MNCAACGADAENSGYAIHRYGFLEGPEVPLCVSCGENPEPTCEQLWEQILSDPEARASEREYRLRVALGEVLEHWREVQHLSLQALATKSGVSLSQIRRLLDREDGDINTRTMVRVIDALGLDLDVCVYRPTAAAVLDPPPEFLDAPLPSHR